MEEELIGSEGELSTGYKLVPWSSWDQWNFVRESIFSSSPASVSAALKRISAWRSRGCLPIPIDVTAAFVEIQQKDPFFRKESTDDSLESEEMLAMLYSMAIMRLVNGFVEQAHKKTGCSISELAETVGIPRVLVDIRHESSHRDLPSLRLVRLASFKALNWLKCNYWEIQKNAIPDVRVEIRSRVREMIYYMRIKHAKVSETKVKRAKKSVLIKGCNKLSSQISGKSHSSNSTGYDKKISKLVKSIARLYSTYPSEIMCVLLEFIRLDGPDFSDPTADADQSDNLSDTDDPRPDPISIKDLKSIILKLSSKEPRLLLSMLKTIFEMIDTKENLIGESNSLASKSKDELSLLTENLSSLVLWILATLKTLKDSGHIDIVGETVAIRTVRNAIPKLPLTMILQKCITLLVTSDKNIVNSALLLVDMIGENNIMVKEKLNTLILLGSDLSNCENIPLEDDNSVEQATEKFESVKIQSNKRKQEENTDDNNNNNNVWTVAKSWIPCPIGMLPCEFTSTAVLPVLDIAVGDELLENKGTKQENGNLVRDVNNSSDADITFDSMDSERVVKKPKQELPECEELELRELKFPMESKLLIDGVWRKLSEDELCSIQSRIKVFQ